MGTDRHRFRFEMKRPSIKGSRILMDGIELKGVISYKIKESVEGGLPIVTLEFFADSVEIVEDRLQLEVKEEMG